MIWCEAFVGAEEITLDAPKSALSLRTGGTCWKVVSKDVCSQSWHNRSRGRRSPYKIFLSQVNAGSTKVWVYVPVPLYITLPHSFKLGSSKPSVNATFAPLVQRHWRGSSAGRAAWRSPKRACKVWVAFQTFHVLNISIFFNGALVLGAWWVWDWKMEPVTYEFEHRDLSYSFQHHAAISEFLASVFCKHRSNAWIIAICWNINESMSSHQVGMLWCVHLSLASYFFHLPVFSTPQLGWLFFVWIWKLTNLQVLRRADGVWVLANVKHPPQCGDLATVNICQLYPAVTSVPSFYIFLYANIYHLFQNLKHTLLSLFLLKGRRR